MSVERAVSASSLVRNPPRFTCLRLPVAGSSPTSATNDQDPWRRGHAFRRPAASYTGGQVHGFATDPRTVWLLSFSRLAQTTAHRSADPTSGARQSVA